MDDVDDLDELELIDQHELEDDDSEESRSGLEAESDDDEATEVISEEQYNQLKCTVIDIITAMGGLEEELDEDGEVQMVYVLGDDCLRCLRDLRTLWRQDDENPNRIIPRICAEVNVLQTGLLPLLLKTVDMGEKGSKIALACTDMMTSITWPLDMEAEQQAILQREDDDGIALATLQVLERALVSYKSAVLRTKSRETKGSKRSVLSAIMLHILLPAISKPRHQRTERDVGTINMCLHLFRNLLAINDPVATSLSSMDVITESRLQSDLVVEMSASRILDTLLMLSSNADSKDFNAWNVIASDCVFYIFAGTKPEDIVIGEKMQSTHSKGTSLTLQAAPARTQSQSELARLLAAEAMEEIETQKVSGSTRHSRFGTMINFTDKDGNRRMATGQAALRKSVEQLTAEANARSKRRSQRRKGLEEKGAAIRRAPWTSKAMTILSIWAERFMRLGYESLTRSVLEDIRRERPKVGDLDQGRTRIMQTGGFFLEYFLLKRQASLIKRQALQEMDNETRADKDSTSDEWPFSLVGQWMEPWALRMAYVRCGSSFEKKRWLEYVAAIRLWTTLFKLIDALLKSSLQEDKDIAEGILATHFYDQAALDSAKSVLSSYTTQSFSCLRAIISLAHILPRTLERYSKDKDHMYVKAKQQIRKSKKDQNSLAEDEMEAQNIAKHEQTERKFEFQQFQSKMCSNNLADACLNYLSRWQEFHDHNSEQVYNVTQVLHRLAIKANDLRLFFPYKRRAIIKSLQSNHSFWSFVQMDAPQVEGDLHKLFEYVMRKFDKLSEDEKAKWGEGMGAPKPIKVFKMPAEIEVNPSRGHLDDVGIAVGLMLEREKLSSVLWIKGCLEEAIRVKKAIIAEERGNETDQDEDAIPTSALIRFADFVMDYDDNDELMAEASTQPEFKLLCRLLALESDETDMFRWIWKVPADALPHELEKDVELIEDFIRRPFETFGETYASMVQRIRKSSVRSIRKIINEHDEEEEVAIRKVKGRRKEKKQPTWVDNDFIEDSDEELEIVAKLIEEQKRQQQSLNDQQHSHSDSSSSSNLGQSSPPSSNHHHSPQKKKIQTRPGALFFDSDEEEEEVHSINNVDQTNVEELCAKLDQRQTKRMLVLSDDEDEASDNEEQQPQMVATQARKRRALIEDDE